VWRLDRAKILTPEINIMARFAGEPDERRLKKSIKGESDFTSTRDEDKRNAVLNCF
jgi:hypothetical protein